MKGIRGYDAKSSLLYDIHAFSICEPTREIYLHGWEDTVEDEEIGVEFRMATRFEKNLNLLNALGEENILIHQHTIGGEWNDGISMFNALQFSKSTTTMLAYAHSRSMSSITIQAADKRVIMPDADFMIHFGDVGIEATAIAAATAARWNERIDARMLEIYAGRCKNADYFKKKTEKQIAAFLKKKIHDVVDWYMMPDEAVYYGFVDGVMGDKGFDNHSVIRKTPRNRLSTRNKG